MMNQQFVEGTSVFDVNGDKVGTVHEASTQGQYLVVQKGWLFPKDLYIPLNAVQRSDAEGVYLNLRKDDLSNHMYDNPPTDMDMDMDTMSARTTETALPAASMGTGTTRGFGANTQVETGEDIRVPVVEEELVVGKQREETGRVHLHTDVVEEEQTVSAPVSREEVVVERVPVQGQYSDVGPDAFTEQDIDVPVMGEELVTGKRAMVTEEVRLHKDVVTEQQQVSDTVRKERVVVEGADTVMGADADGENTDYNTRTNTNR